MSWKRPGPNAGHARGRSTGRSGLVGLLEEVAGAVHVDRDARAHGRGHGDLRDVAPLGGGGLQPQDLVERRHVVLGQLLLSEGDFTALAVSMVTVPVFGLGMRPRDRKSVV